MKNQDLIDRYVYAVVKHLPRRQAEDIDRELHGLIEDMLLERCAERPPEQKDVLVVLTELGTPQELAAQYSGDKERCLIAQPWYHQYKLVLKWVLFAVALGITVSMLVSTAVAAVEGELNGWRIGENLLEWVGALFSALLSATGALTLLYAFLQRKGISVEESLGFSTNLKELPPVPKKEEKINRADAIAEIIFSVLLVCIFVFAPQIICGVFRNGDEVEVIPFFDISVIRSIWYLFVGMMLCGVADGIFMLAEGRYTFRLAAVNGVTNLICLILTGIFVFSENVVNQECLDRLLEAVAGNVIAAGMISNIPILIFGLIALAILLDFGVVLFRAWKYGNGRSA